MIASSFNLYFTITSKDNHAVQVTHKHSETAEDKFVIQCVQLVRCNERWKVNMVF